MVSDIVLKLEKQLTENQEFRHPRDLPHTFVDEAIMLPDNELLELAAPLCKLNEFRYMWAGLTVIHRHPSAFRRVQWQFLKPIGNLMDHWAKVDIFADLAGPAWQAGQISDARVMSWTRSDNRWWRRAALVCTVYLNRKARGGKGDTPRTLAVCEVLASDKDDMVAKGLSWALRDLIAHDRRAVEDFLIKHEKELPALVKREVRSKLMTGRKNPPRKRG